MEFQSDIPQIRRWSYCVPSHVCDVRLLHHIIGWWYWPLLPHRVRWAWKISFSFPTFILVAPVENITIRGIQNIRISDEHRWSIWRIGSAIVCLCLVVLCSNIEWWIFAAMKASRRKHNRKFNTIKVIWFLTKFTQCRKYENLPCTTFTNHSQTHAIGHNSCSTARAPSTIGQNIVCLRFDQKWNL